MCFQYSLGQVAHEWSFQSLCRVPTLCCAVTKGFLGGLKVLQNNPLWLVLTGLNKQYSSPDLECGLLRGGVSELELDKAKLTFL